MISKDNYPKIKTDETLMETVSHGSMEYPFKYYYEDIWLFDLHCIDWHWHPEVEFVYMEKGEGEFLIGSEHYTLSEGMGLFINSQAIHRFEAEKSAVIPNIVFSPMLLAAQDTLVYRKFIQPLIDSSIECEVFSPAIPWHKEVLKTLMYVFDVQNNPDICEIKSVELMLKIWALMLENLKISDRNPSAKSSAHIQGKLQIMMQFIHNNFSDRISLEDIANCASISKSSAMNIFKKYLHTSPVNYLVGYRLRAAARFLASTDRSVLSVAMSCGFENTGYFCRRFKEMFGVTPGKYKKEQQSRRIHQK